jgi:hypothetical protein
VAERQAELVNADVERLVLLDDILHVVLDKDLDDTAVGSAMRGLGGRPEAPSSNGEADQFRGRGQFLVMVWRRSYWCVSRSEGR